MCEPCHQPGLWPIHSHICTCPRLLGWWYRNLSLRHLSWALDIQFHVDILWELQMNLFIFLLSCSESPDSVIAPSLFPVTGSQVLSHLSLFHFLQHCAILNGCQISAIPFSKSLSYSCELKEPRKLSHPPSSGNWVGIWPRSGYSCCLWQTDAKVTSHGPHFLVLMPLGGPSLWVWVGPVTCF